MADADPSPPPSPPPSRLQSPSPALTALFPPWSLLLLKVLSKRRTWVCLFLLVYSVLILSSWRFLLSIRSWYAASLAASPSPSPIPALYASVLYGAVFGLLSMGAALAVAVPATVVTWITVLVLLTFAGRRRRDLVEEGRRATRDIVMLVARVLLKEGNLAAALCALASFVALVIRRSGSATGGREGGEDL